MPDYPDFHRALERILDLTYPPVTLSVPPGRALGHRLAHTITARGNQPSRPVALADGLAVMQRDVQVRDAAGPAAEQRPPEEEPQEALPPLPPPREDIEAGAADEDAAASPAAQDATAAAPARRKADDPTGRHVMRLAGDDNEDRDPDDWTEDELSANGEGPADEGSAHEAAAGALAAANVDLQLRARPTTNRREDALAPGQAVAVSVGSEVPRGADLIYPLDELAGPPAPYDFNYAPPQTARASETRRNDRRGPRRNERPRRGEPREAPEEPEDNDEPENMPLPEPERNWDLPARYATGRVNLPVSRQRLPRRLIPIGAWARNRETLLPERALLRAPELALLEACGVNEVDIYRRPVVGVACLGQPFPLAGQQPDGRRPGIDPLSTLVQYLCRAAQVAALPLGFAPTRFRPLRAAVERWTRQVDILLLVGGSHHGPRCLGHDVLASFGQVAVSGLDLDPAGSLSAGMAGPTPVFVMPGTLPDVLAGFVLFARPLAHKYFLPQHFLGELPVTLDCGSQLNFEHNTAVPLRFGYDRQAGQFRSRYSGQRGEPWLDCIRGQAIAVFEAGRQYRDGDTIPAAVY
jgi:molybdopterin biosynthesis enzyme